MKESASARIVKSLDASRGAIFVLSQGSGVFGLILAFSGFGIAAISFGLANQVNSVYYAVVAWGAILVTFGVLAIYQSMTLRFRDSRFEVSHFGRVTRFDYSEIRDARELLYRGRGDHAALGYDFGLGDGSKSLSFKVAARGSRKATEFTSFIKQKVNPARYHECDEHNPDYIRFDWW